MVIDKNMDILSANYNKIIIEKEDGNEVLAVITNQGVALENGYISRFVPKYDYAHLCSTSTATLVEALKSRKGVETQIAEPYSDLTVTVNGPAIVLIVTD